MYKVLQVSNLSKVYKVGEWGTGTISHDLNRWWKTKILHQEDPYAKVGQTNDRTQKAQKDEFVWAIKDINFEVKQGEVLGIIGKNGAGKSTLLKVLSRITAPTTGQALIKGRVASLLEVGTGFHPEMTGRENIYLNGTINGMSRPEITRKLDEIVDFAGVAKHLDTPVKRYSSGMQVRLGFAVAAHLDPEILIVDEVLAVGDAEFQKKAIGKMKDVSHEEGRTVLFVSHNMGSLKKLCSRAILLDKGKLNYSDNVDSVVAKYLNEDVENHLPCLIWNKIDNAPGDNEVKLTEFMAIDEHGKVKDTFETSENIYIRIKSVVFKKQPYFRFTLYFVTVDGTVAFTTMDSDNDTYREKPLDIGKHVILCKIPKNFLNKGSYYISLDGGIFNYKSIFKKAGKLSISIISTSGASASFNEARKGAVAPLFEWERNTID